MSDLVRVQRAEFGAAKPDGTRYVRHMLTVPAAIGRAIPEDVRFAVELTEDGILYRVQKIEAADPNPAWLDR